MSIKAFHIVFISLSILMSAFFTLWGAREYSVFGTTESLIYSLIGFVGTLGLGVYLKFVFKKYKDMSYL